MITVYVGALSTRTGNNYAWMWSTKNKKGTWGKSESTETVAEIFAIISALNKLSAYSSNDIVFKTSKQEIVKLIEKPTNSSHTAVVQLRQAIYMWKGKVRAQYVIAGAQDETQRYVVTTLNNLVNKKLVREPVAPKEMTQRIVELGVKQRNATVLKKPMVKPRKKTREVLVTSFLDEDDRPATVFDASKDNRKPVLCSSCNTPINPYTNECRCSR
jgi:ribonuclease HI